MMTGFTAQARSLEQSFTATFHRAQIQTVTHSDCDRFWLTDSDCDRFLLLLTNCAVSNFLLQRRRAGLHWRRRGRAEEEEGQHGLGQEEQQIRQGPGDTACSSLNNLLCLPHYRCTFPLYLTCAYYLTYEGDCPANTVDCLTLQMLSAKTYNRRFLANPTDKYARQCSGAPRLWLGAPLHWLAFLLVGFARHRRLYCLSDGICNVCQTLTRVRNRKSKVQGQYSFKKEVRNIGLKIDISILK